MFGETHYYPKNILLLGPFAEKSTSDRCEEMSPAPRVREFGRCENQAENRGRTTLKSTVRLARVG